MNQIICTSSSNIDILATKYIKKRALKIIFYFFTLISIFFTIYYLYFIYNRYSHEKISKDLVNNFNLTNIYLQNSEYTINLINKEDIIYNFQNLSSYVIGIIEIKKINITYPILSKINNDFLKISPCKFYGPNPNNIGNLCIAAHNYKNDSFFSKISTLVNGDIITIYDFNGKSLDYVVYSVYTTSSKDTSCISQDTDNLRVITLVTCNSINNNYRTIVKAKEF